MSEPIQKLPNGEDYTSDAIQVLKGLDAAAQGRVVSQADVEKRIAQWLEK